MKSLLRRNCAYYRYNLPAVVRRRLVILTAVTLEARAVARALGLATPKPGRPVRTDTAVPTVEIHLIGIGATQMPQDLQDPPTCGIILAGLAGALDPSLRVGDIVVDECPAAFLPSTPFCRGKILAANAIVSTAKDKAALFHQTHALAVDMESDAVRAVAASLHVPFVCVRAISDAADETLDPAVLRLVDAFGRPRPLSIAANLTRRPSLIGQLRRLERSARLAGENLARAVTGIVHEWTAIELMPSRG